MYVRSYKMELKEAKNYLNSKGYILEDTDDWDEADMPVSFTKKNREETVKRHNGRNWYSSAGVDARANKHDDLEDKVRQAYDFNIKSLFYGLKKELQKYYKKVDLKATDYDDEKKSQLVRYYFKYNKNSYMLEVMYYDEDGVIVIQIMDEDEVGIERDDFSITTVDKAIKHIVDFTKYNVV